MRGKGKGKEKKPTLKSRKSFCFFFSFLCLNLLAWVASNSFSFSLTFRSRVCEGFRLRGGQRRTIAAKKIDRCERERQRENPFFSCSVPLLLLSFFFFLLLLLSSFCFFCCSVLFLIKFSIIAYNAPTYTYPFGKFLHVAPTPLGIPS